MSMALWNAEQKTMSTSVGRPSDEFEKQLSCEFDVSWPMCLYTAASLGSVPEVHSILKTKQVSVNKLNRGLWSPLMYAAYYGHDAVSVLLIKAGGDVNLKNKQGQTPLMLASMCGHLNLVQILLQNGCLLDATDEIGMSALFYAAHSGYEGIVHLLLSVGANANSVERSRGLSPLLLAAADGHDVLVQLLLKKGANISHQTYTGQSAWSLATAGHHGKVLALLDGHVSRIKSLTSLFWDSTSTRFGGSGRMSPAAPSKPAVVESPRHVERARPPRTADLASVLEGIGLSKYLAVFEEQEIDLAIFVTMTDADLQEIGINLLGPRRKMCNAIERWRLGVPVSGPHKSGADGPSGGVQSPKLHVVPARRDVDNLQTALERVLSTTTTAERHDVQRDNFAK